MSTSTVRSTLSISSSRPAQQHWRRFTPPAVLVLAAVLIAMPSLSSLRIDDVDSAHHIMDGIFFRDFIADLPGSVLHPISYTLAYYKQYPALGFILWPPLFPALEGVFFLLFGIDVRIARVCVLAFGIVFALAGYSVLKRSVPRGAALGGVLVTICTPMFALYYQEVMREIPALCMAMLAIWSYLRWVDDDMSAKKLAGFVVLSAAAVYTKQTIVFIFPAILLDLVVNHRHLVSTRRLWIAALVLLVLVAPLGVFTATIGKANVQQSVGSDKAYVFNSAAPPDRWTFAAWFFYVLRLPRILHWLVIAFGAAGLVLGLINREFFRRNALWFGWAASWFLLFSYFLNKQDRYALFWLPAWGALASAFLAHTFTVRRWRTEYVGALLLIPLLVSAQRIPRITIDGFDGVDTMVQQLLARNVSGNILYIGEYHQIMVPFVRQYDPARQIHVLRGLEILADTPDVLAAARDYRVRLIISQGNTAHTAELLRLASHGSLSAGESYSIATAGPPVTLNVFEYRGPVAAVQKQVPLGVGKIGQGAASGMKLTR